MTKLYAVFGSVYHEVSRGLLKHRWDESSGVQLGNGQVVRAHSAQLIGEVSLGLRHAEASLG